MNERAIAVVSEEIGYKDYHFGQFDTNLYSSFQILKCEIYFCFTVPCFPSCRATLCLVGFCGGLLFFLMRSNISVAVVCMTTPQYVVVSEWPGVFWNGRFNLTEKETYCMKRPTKRGYSELQGLYTIYQKKKCAESESKSKFNPPYGRVSTILKHSVKTFAYHY